MNETLQATPNQWQIPTHWQTLIP